MIGDFTLDPPFPAGQIVGLGALAAVLAVSAYASARGAGRRPRALLAALRLSALAVVTVLLLRPMRLLPTPKPDRKPPFYVLVDTSASMNTRDMAPSSRYRAAAGALRSGSAEFLRRLRQRTEVQAFAFSDSLRRVDFAELEDRKDATGERTDMAQALAGIVSASDPATPHAGVLLLSDGRNNCGEDVGAAARLLKTRGIPLWTVCLGTAEDAPDVSLTARLSQKFLFCGRPATLAVLVSHSQFPHRRVKVNLYREGVYVASRQATLSRGMTQVDFPVEEAHKGVFKYRVSVDPLSGEADLRNNARTVFARVVEEKTRVLLVEARPHWDSKFLARALQQDPSLNVTSIFYLSAVKVFAVRESTSAETLADEVSETPLEMPRTRDELYRYDCLVLGRDMDRLLTAEEMHLLKDYLTDRGGSVVFFRGRAYNGESVLADVEPVSWADELVRNVRLELTPEGRVSPVFSWGLPQPADLIVRSLPGLTSVTRIDGRRSLAVVLAVGESAERTEPMAALAYQRYGKGKVMSIGAAGLWRWALMSPEQQEYDDVYARLWRQVVQWMVFESDFLPGRDIAFRTGAYTYVPGSRVIFTVSTKHIEPRHYRPWIEVRPPEGGMISLEPRAEEGHPTEYAAVFQPREEGEYEAILHSNVGEPKKLSVRFTVYADLVEQRLVAADEALLARAAAVTGGEALSLDGLRELPGKVSALARAARTEAEPVDAWSVAWVLLTLGGLLGAEWYLRRRWGLV